MIKDDIPEDQKHSFRTANMYHFVGTLGLVASALGKHPKIVSAQRNLSLALKTCRVKTDCLRYKFLTNFPDWNPYGHWNNFILRKLLCSWDDWGLSCQEICTLRWDNADFGLALSDLLRNPRIQRNHRSWHVRTRKHSFAKSSQWQFRIYKLDVNPWLV